MRYLAVWGSDMRLSGRLWGGLSCTLHRESHKFPGIPYRAAVCNSFAG